MDVHVGRQPLFDRARRVVGHELLFRDDDVAHAALSETVATAQVLLTSYLDLGLDALVGQGLAFVKLPRSFVTSPVLPPEPERLVVELLEDESLDEQLVGCLQALSAAGVRLAVTADVWAAAEPALARLVSYVRVDVPRTGWALAAVVQQCHEAGVQVVADRVETPDQLQACREAAVDLLQGPLLRRPDVLRGRSLSPRQLSCLGLVRALQHADGVRVDEVVELVRRDPALSYRLLCAANSASTGRSRQVTALREAVLLLGFGQLRRWALLMLAADLPEEAAAGVEAAFLRASMCELMAAGTDAVAPDEAFVVGLLSSLDLLLGQPLEQVLEHLPLAPATAGAVLRQEGPLGAVLASVLAYEDGVLSVPAASGLPGSAPRSAFLGALSAAARSSELLAAG